MLIVINGLLVIEYDGTEQDDMSVGTSYQSCRLFVGFVFSIERVDVAQPRWSLTTSWRRNVSILAPDLPSPDNSFRCRYWK